MTASGHPRPPDTRPVLVAYDGSPEAQAAVHEAATLLGDRPLVVVTVWERGMAAIAAIPTLDSAPTVPTDPLEVVALDRAAHDHATRVAERGAGLARELGVSAEALAVPDELHVADTIATIADERDARAIVVGSRGLGRVKARLLGSTSQGLLHRTHRPVLVVRVQEGGRE